MAVMAAVHWAVICARVWSDHVRRDSCSSCKSSPALLLKMEQHTILSFVNLSSAFSLTPLAYSSLLSFFFFIIIVSPFSRHSYLCCRFFFPPPLVCHCALLPELSVDAVAPQSLTDREPMTAALSQGPVTHSGPGSHTDEVINDLMSFFTHSPTETWGGFYLFLSRCKNYLCRFELIDCRYQGLCYELIIYL